MRKVRTIRAARRDAPQPARLLLLRRCGCGSAGCRVGAAGTIARHAWTRPKAIATHETSRPASDGADRRSHRLCVEFMVVNCRLGS